MNIWKTNVNTETDYQALPPNNERIHWLRREAGPGTRSYDSCIVIAEAEKDVLDEGETESAVLCLEGKAIIALEGGESVELTPGDFVALAAGLKRTWTVVERFKAVSTDIHW